MLKDSEDTKLANHLFSQSSSIFSRNSCLQLFTIILIQAYFRDIAGLVLDGHKKVSHNLFLLVEDLAFNLLKTHTHTQTHLWSTMKQCAIKWGMPVLVTTEKSFRDLGRLKEIAVRSWVTGMGRYLKNKMCNWMILEKRNP